MTSTIRIIGIILYGVTLIIVGILELTREGLYLLLLGVACGGIIIIGFSGYILILITFFGPAATHLVSLQYAAAEDVGQVNPFYGPGTFLGWLLIALVTAFIYILGSPSTKIVKPDPTAFLATFSYALLAALDSLRRMARHEFDAQLNAALVVCHFAIFLSGFCLLSTEGGSRWAYRWCWQALFFTMVVPTVVGDIILCFSGFQMLRCSATVAAGLCHFLGRENVALCYFAVNWAGVWSSALFIKARAEPGKSWLQHWFDNAPPRVVFAFPKSEAKFSDLDQFSVLVGTAGGMVYLLWKTWRRIYQRSGNDLETQSSA